MPTTEPATVTAADATLDLACKLIARPSVTPDDGGCQDLMIERLEALGFVCTPLRFGDTQNFWARWGDPGTPGPLFVFAGHTDVVPPGPLSAWDSAPFEPTIRDGLLFGRGAADMKGSLAAMVTACERFCSDPAPKHGSIGFLITSDEEGPATNGTVKVMEWLRSQSIQIDYCLVGEPSSSEVLGDVIKNGRRGSLGGVITFKGLQGHVAYPQHADNPVHRALPALAELVAKPWDNGNDYFPPTTLQITNVQAGTGVSNVIPGTMELWLNFRFSTEQTAAGLQQQVEDCFSAHGVNADIQWKLSGEPFLTEVGALVEAARASIQDVAHCTPLLSTTGGTSDGRFIAPYGAQVVELGPINASIHRVNEHVRVADLAPLSTIYEGILRRLLGAPG